MKIFFYFLIFLSLFYATSAAVTEAQMAETRTMLRNVCKPKSKLADDVIDKMSDKVFPTDKASKCFIQCILENMGMMRKSKIQYEAAMKQFDLLLPDSMKEGWKGALTACKDSSQGEKNPCEAAYKLVFAKLAFKAISGKKMRVIFNYLVFVSFFYVSLGAMTQEQMDSSAAMIRKTCQPKSKLSDDIINKMSEKVFPDTKESKCFMHCVAENMQLMRKAKLNYDSALKSFDTMLPDPIKDDYKNALSACKDAANGEKNSCEAAYKILTCFANKNPSFRFV
ncbi:uncharacterized protein LOC116347992 [Contarinia nasturtii]|uniref:uncharacterized protein LOC116347992 n=1 Tax=Contarinia nasturtii TaxID=265458 RepID=UPI0012D41EF4|nr:uncharacterized protein LOC116347992 [Contarinia nasturtii]